MLASFSQDSHRVTLTLGEALSPFQNKGHTQNTSPKSFN